MRLHNSQYQSHGTVFFISGQFLLQWIFSSRWVSKCDTFGEGNTPNVMIHGYLFGAIYAYDLLIKRAARQCLHNTIELTQESSPDISGRNNRVSCVPENTSIVHLLFDKVVKENYINCKFRYRPQECRLKRDHDNS